MKRMVIVGLSSMVLALSVQDFAQMGLAQMGPAAYPADLKPTQANLAYSSVSKAQVLDLFVPAENGPFPLVINIHGGGFFIGSKEMLDAPIARLLLQNKIAVASINYRLSGEAKFPAAIQDAKAAVRFLRAKAGQYKLNPSKFLAFGQSAGGNLASLLGTSAGTGLFEDPKLGNAQTSSRVQGVIDWFGPTDFLKLDAQAKAQGCPPDHDAATSPESKYLGTPIQQVPNLAKQANPITYIDKTDPPFLLQKGDKDCLIPFAQSQLLHDALQATGVPVSLETMKGAGHSDMGLTTPIFLSETNLKRVLEFVKTTLK